MRRIWKCFDCGGGALLDRSRVIAGSLGGDDATLENVGGSGVNGGGDDGGGDGRPCLGCEADESTSLNYGSLCDLDSANATALSLRSYSGVGVGVGEVMGTGRVLQQTGSAEEVQRCLACSLLAHDAGQSGAAIHLPDRMLDLKDFLDAHGGNAPPSAGVNLLPRAVVVQPFGLIKMRFYGNWPEERLRSGKPVKYYYLSMDYGHHLSIESLGLEVQLHGPSVCFCPSTLMVLAMSREGGRLHRAAEEVWDRLQEAYRSGCRAPGHPTSTFCGQAIFLVPAFETVVCDALLCDQHRRYDVRQKADVCM
ncbi:hypothetical protein D0869_12739 [Hortaea werneckii]|uniref:Uncharacterized protein n=1 Tax=Hortaea werneckii TaxID=91943 RepID=A0A3M6W752_HORWE|nr:hypothetical protein D0869_12739 [Hortaea werneckii]